MDKEHLLKRISELLEAFHKNTGVIITEIRPDWLISGSITDRRFNNTASILSIRVKGE